MEVKIAIAINQLSGNKQMKFENMMFLLMNELFLLFNLF